MDLGLKDKRVFVSGSSKGIGRAIAAEFLAEGARVTITGRNAEAVDSTADELKTGYPEGNILSLPGDLAQPSFIKESLSVVEETWGGVDCVAANLGSGSGPFGWDLEEKDWNDAFRVNFDAARRLVEAALPGMVERRCGSVVFITSLGAVERMAAPLPYNAAKAATMNYARNLSSKVAKQGIRINSVAPGNITFPGSFWDDKDREDPDKSESYIKKNIPMRRFGTPREVAAAVVFLASERASFITGASLLVDGGQSRRY